MTNIRVGTSGILINQYNQVLLIQRDDSRTWAPPGGALDAGELPNEGVVREVKEETGILVMPVRLALVQFLPITPYPILSFTFRCLQRGGNIEPSDESPQVGFVAMNELPRSMSTFHRGRLERTAVHTGGGPDWYVEPISWRTNLWRIYLQRVVYPWKDLRRKWQGKPTYVPPPTWDLSAFTIIRDEQGRVLWVKRTDQDVWNLPGGVGVENEPPWETAVRETQEETGLTVELSAITGVYLYESDKPHLSLAFTASIQNGTLTTGPESAEFAYFAPGEEPENTVKQHLERVMDAISDSDEPAIRRQPGPNLIT